MEEINPYSPPEAVVEDRLQPAGEQHYGEASMGQRFANFAIDYVVVTMCALTVMVVLAIVVGDVALEDELMLYAVAGSVQLVYYVASESLLGRTIGKFVTGTRVVARGGQPARFKQIVGRTLVRFVPFEPFSFLGVRGWHDAWSGTRVVRTRGTEQDRRRMERKASSRAASKQAMEKRLARAGERELQSGDSPD